jgi:hypothetical protein
MKDSGSSLFSCIDHFKARKILDENLKVKVTNLSSTSDSSDHERIIVHVITVYSCFSTRYMNSVRKKMCC